MTPPKIVQVVVACPGSPATGGMAQGLIALDENGDLWQGKLKTRVLDGTPVSLYDWYRLPGLPEPQKPRKLSDEPETY